MSTADQIAKSLLLLKPEELASVRDQATVLLALGSKKGTPRLELRVNGEEDYARDLYAAFAEELSARTRVRSMPYNVFCRNSQYTTHFQPGARAAFQANAQWFPRQSRAERLSMVRLYAKLTLEYLAAQGRPAVWFNIAAALAVLPEVVDTAFPGYAASGLLGKVQTLRCKGPSSASAV